MKESEKSTKHHLNREMGDNTGHNDKYQHHGLPGMMC